MFLPDSVLSGVERLLLGDPEVDTVVCAREDEGIAIAVGASLAGRFPVALMEGSGVGYSALMLARAVSQRTPLLLVFSHTRADSSPFDYHATSRVAGEAVCGGLAIPVVVVGEEADIARSRVEHAGRMAAGQRAVVAVAVAGHLRA